MPENKAAGAAFFAQDGEMEESPARAGGQRKEPARADGRDEDFSLEEALEQLDGMLEKLSDRETPLEETFLTYQAGMELLKKCEAKVDLIEKKVMVLNDEGGMDEL